MATVAPARVSAKVRLAELRNAARLRKDEEWGDIEEMKRESLRVHNAFEPARKRANATKTSE